MTAVETAFLESAAALRRRATDGVTVLDRNPVVLVVASESRAALNIARDWSAIADAFEREAPP